MACYRGKRAGTRMISASLILVMLHHALLRLNQAWGGPDIILSDSESAQKNEETFYITTDNRNISIPSAKSLLSLSPRHEDINIFRLSPNMTTSPNTIVSTYFRIASKHSSDNYDNWMKYFLGFQDHMIIFTQPELFTQIKELRSHALDRTVIILMEIEELEIGRLFPDEFWKDQLERDYEKERHKSFQLFWIWLAKSGLVNEAIHYNFFQSDLFVWSDIGSFRDAPFGLGQTLILHPEIVPRHEVLHTAFQPPIPPETNLFDDKRKFEKNFYHCGMHAAAYKDTWKIFHEHFLDTIDRFLERNMLLVDDQVVMQSTCLSHPEICAYLRSEQVHDMRFRAMRTALHRGGDFQLWRYNSSMST